MKEANLNPLCCFLFLFGARAARFPGGLRTQAVALVGAAGHYLHTQGQQVRIPPPLWPTSVQWDLSGFLSAASQMAPPAGDSVQHLSLSTAPAHNV